MLHQVDDNFSSIPHVNLKKLIDSDWNVHKNSPIYIQIADFLMSYIENMDVYIDSLPGHRKLSEMFGVSINTILNALHILETRGEIKISAKKRPEILHQNKSIVDWGHYTNASRLNARASGFSKFVGSSNVMNLSTGFDKCYSLKASFNKVLPDIHLPLDLSCTFLGLWEFKKEIANLIKNYNIQAKSSEIMITIGMTYSLSILFITLLGPHTNLILPNLSNISNAHMAGMTGANLIRVPMDEEGVDANRLSYILKANQNCILCIPADFNIPTGIMTSAERKKEIMELCIKYQVPIIELIHMPLMFYDESFVTFKSMDRNNLVIQVSQIAPFGIATPWLGWIVADRKLLYKLLDIRLNMDAYDCYLNQFAALEMLKQGIYKQYINDIRKINKNRIPQVNSLLNQYFGEYATWNEKNQDFAIWLKLKNNINTNDLYKNAKTIKFHPGSFYDPRDKSHIFINPMSKDIRDLEYGFNELRKIIESSL